MKPLARSGRATPPEVAPAVAELLARGRSLAAAFGATSIEPSHVALVLIDDPDAHTYRALHRLGLNVEEVRRELTESASRARPPELALDADALAAIGIDLELVRSRLDAAFGAGAFDRASARRGSCGATEFGIAPSLKQALSNAREAARGAGETVGRRDVLLALSEPASALGAALVRAGVTVPELRHALLAEADAG